jgi:hypothetical protein
MAIYGYFSAAFHDIIAEKTMGYPLTSWLPVAIAITGLVYLVGKKYLEYRVGSI